MRPWRCVLCEKVMPSCQAHTHEPQCPEGRIPCKHCKELIPRRSMDEHLPTCPQAPVPCSLDCGATFPRAQTRKHETCCPLVPILCQLPGGGCSRWFPRHDEAAHHATCFVECPTCTKDFLRTEIEEHSRCCPPEKEAEIILCEPCEAPARGPAKPVPVMKTRVLPTAVPQRTSTLYHPYPVCNRYCLARCSRSVHRTSWMMSQPVNIHWNETGEKSLNSIRARSGNKTARIEPTRPHSAPRGGRTSNIPCMLETPRTESIELCPRLKAHTPKTQTLMIARPRSATPSRNSPSRSKSKTPIRASRARSATPSGGKKMNRKSMSSSRGRAPSRTPTRPHSATPSRKSKPKVTNLY